jgi:CcmD family protein
MYKKLYTSLLLSALLFLGLFVRAQDGAGDRPVEMADRMRADGKIYIVVAVLVTIFLGLILYVVRLDRKISRLEKETK